MKRWQCINAFVHATKAGSFRKAALELGLSPATVARYVSALENSIGTKLLIRTAKPLRLTYRGQNYFLACRRLLDDIEKAEAAVKNKSANGAASLNA